MGKKNGIVLNDKKGELDYTKSIDIYGDYIYAVVDRSHTKTGSSSALMSINKNKKDENRFFTAKANSSNGTFKNSSAPKDMRKKGQATMFYGVGAVSYTHLRAHETVLDLVCRLLLEKKK